MGEIKSKGAFFICIVAVILIIVMLIAGGKKDNDKTPTNNVPTNNATTGNVVQEKEEYVEKQEDGGKVNTSEQLKKTKKVAGIELTNIRLVEYGGITQLLADATNTTSVEVEQMDIIVTAMDKAGNTLAEFEASIYNLAPGKTTGINAGITEDIANAYDFTVKMK